MDTRWQTDWYRLVALDALEEGQGARVTFGETTVVARRHAGEIVAHRDPCPACAASLESARIEAGATAVSCPACGAESSITPDGGPGTLHIPIMLVDGVAYVFLGVSDDAG